jgi:hypothetical protein
MEIKPLHELCIWMLGLSLTVGGVLYFTSSKSKEFISSSERVQEKIYYNFVLERESMVLYGKFRDEREYNFDLYDTNEHICGSGNMVKGKFLSLYLGNEREHFNFDGEVFKNWTEKDIRINIQESTIEDILE